MLHTFRCSCCRSVVVRFKEENADSRTPRQAVEAVIRQQEAALEQQAKQESVKQEAIKRQHGKQESAKREAALEDVVPGAEEQVCEASRSIIYLHLYYRGHTMATTRMSNLSVHASKVNSSFLPLHAVKRALKREQDA